VRLPNRLDAIASASVLLVAACATVPITGRRQLSIIPDSTLLGMSFQEYETFLKEHKPVTGGEDAAMVRRVGTRIQNAVEQHLASRNMLGRLSGYRWEFNLVESKDANAWCMPGGKVVVYTGLLPITGTEAGLATVMGHEIAHAVAEHGRERMSQALLAQLGGAALDVALAQKPEQTRALWASAYGLGAQYGALLPFSRLQESEADRLGLIFMAIAGYDPKEAVGFWQRMAQQESGRAPPEFLSTHPSDEARIREIQALLPEAEAYYRR
jgi:predicted Zn-dependent protease